jgi:hypothetical protein
MLGLMRYAVMIVAVSRERASAWSSCANDNVLLTQDTRGLQPLTYPRTCASITHTSAPQLPYVASGLTAADVVSMWPGKSQTYVGRSGSRRER